MEYLKGNYTVINTGHCPKNPYKTGYGSKIPTRYLLRFLGKKYTRRIYAICYSNCASYYVNVKGRREFIPEHKF